MAQAKRPSLAAGLPGAVNKGSRSAEPEATVEPVAASDIMEDGPGLTLYLKRHSYEALKQLGITERKPVHALLVEAVAILFESRNLSANALAGNRPGSKYRVTK